MRTEIITENISRAADILFSGGLVAVPTETVYGLAANGLDADAVKKIYDVKGRPEIKALSLMVANADAMDLYCENVPKQAKILAQKFWPGPLTIVLKSKDTVPAIVRAGGETVGLRCPAHPVTCELLHKLSFPLAAPSANPSGEESPKSADKVHRYFDGKIDAIIDGGVCSFGQESTIIDMSQTPYTILRQGAIPEEAIWAALVDGLTLVGITGGTGCGKTTALNVLRQYGALVIDCDAVYHELTRSSAAMREEIMTRFGDVYDGTDMNRKKLGNIVFADPQALLDLNHITHKFVDGEIERRLTEHAKNGGSIAAIDAIALLEAAFAKRTAFNVAVTAPVEDRVRRLVAREGIGEEYARKRIAAQKSNEDFETNCDYVLHNDADMIAFETQCQHFFTEVLRNV